MFGNLFDSRLWRSARRERVALALTIGLGLAGGILTVLQAHYLSQAVAQVFLSGASLPALRPGLIALLIIAIFRAAAVWGGESAAARVAAGVKTHLRVRLFAHLQALGPAYTHSAASAEGERSGELTNTAIEGIEALDGYFSQYLPQLALAALAPLTILVFVFPLDAISGLVLLLTAPLIPVFMALIGTLADGLTRRQWTTLSRLSAHFLDVLQGLTTLKLFGRSREQVAVIAEMSERFREATMDVLRVSFLSALVLEMVATLSTAVVAVEIGLRLLNGRLIIRPGVLRADPCARILLAAAPAGPALPCGDSRGYRRPAYLRDSRHGARSTGGTEGNRRTWERRGGVSASRRVFGRAAGYPL